MCDSKGKESRRYIMSFPPLKLKYPLTQLVYYESSLLLLVDQPVGTGFSFGDSWADSQSRVWNGNVFMFPSPIIF